MEAQTGLIGNFLRRIAKDLQTQKKKQPLRANVCLLPYSTLVYTRLKYLI